jgi:drug/metabolite transporter (DMT)-like permease
VVSQHSQIALSKVANIAITTPVWLGWTALFALTLMNLSVNLLVTQGFRSVPASYGSILLLLEPVVALLIGTFLFNEPVQPLGLFGSALIFIGGFVAIWSAGRIRQRKAKVNLSSGLQRSLEDFKKEAHSQSL